MHEARTLDEFEDVQIPTAEEQVEHGWRGSKKIPVLLFAGALVLFFGITYIARQFESQENLQGVVIEGNGSLLNSEIFSLASIDTKQKFYDIDLKQIEQRIQKHGLIRHAILRRETNPNRIIIHIDEREPIALIRSQSGEPILVDREYKFFLPKRLSGLKNPERLLSVPLLGGVSERDSATIIPMAKMVQMIRSIADGALKDAIGELRRTSTGAFVIYTSATSTPIFIGMPQDERFQTTLEADANALHGAEQKESLFVSQIKLLASMWQKNLKDELLKKEALYVDARFDGEIIMKKRGAATAHRTPVADSAKILANAAIVH